MEQVGKVFVAGILLIEFGVYASDRLLDHRTPERVVVLLKGADNFHQLIKNRRFFCGGLVLVSGRRALGARRGLLLHLGFFGDAHEIVVVDKFIATIDQQI